MTRCELPEPTPASATRKHTPRLNGSRGAREVKVWCYQRTLVKLVLLRLHAVKLDETGVAELMLDVASDIVLVIIHSSGGSLTFQSVTPTRGSG